MSYLAILILAGGEGRRIDPFFNVNTSEDLAEAARAAR